MRRFYPSPFGLQKLWILLFSLSNVVTIVDQLILFHIGPCSVEIYLQVPNGYTKV
jgi:hypothetical protein